MEDIQEIKRWVANCAADPLASNDPRYVPLHALKLEDGTLVNLRGEDWLAPISNRIKLSNKPTCQLFSGFTGTGKTTELLRLKKQLTDWGYIVLWADAKDYLDLNHPLAVEDLLVTLAAAFGDAAAKAFPGKPEVRDGYWTRLTHFLKETEVKLDSVGLNKLINLKTALFHGATPVWLEVRRQLASNLGRLKANAHSYVVDVIDHIRDNPEQEVVFILDSLEKLRGPADQFQNIMAGVVQVFSQHHDILKLPNCHVIYTVPPYAGLQGANTAAYYDNHLNRPLPAIKVVTQNPHKVAPAKDGIAGLRQLLKKRIDVDKVFGRDDTLVQDLVVYSGGNLRYLLGMVEDLIVNHFGNPFPVDRAGVERIIKLRKEHHARGIRPDHVEVLYQVHQSGDIQIVRDDQLAILARYMDGQMVLCYQNGDGWFQLHPMIVDNVIKRKKEASKGPDDQPVELATGG